MHRRSFNQVHKEHLREIPVQEKGEKVRDENSDYKWNRDTIENVLGKVKDTSIEYGLSNLRGSVKDSFVETQCVLVDSCYNIKWVGKHMLIDFVRYKVEHEKKIYIGGFHYYSKLLLGR